MIRAQRRAHLRAWLVLAPLAAAALAMAVASRPQAPIQHTPTPAPREAVP